MLAAAGGDRAAGDRDDRHITGKNNMENVWDATKLMFMVYGIAAVVSFLIAWIIKLTFVVIRMRRPSGKPSEAQAQGGPESGA
jgi:hypothetical protein